MFSVGRGHARPILFLILALASCSRQKPTAETNPPVAAVQTPRALPKYKGSVTAADGVHAEVSVTAEGDYQVYFMDPLGDDLPAAELSGVSLEVSKQPVALHINDTGETWVGKSAPLPDSVPAARVDFSYQNKPVSGEVQFALVNAPLDWVCPMDPDIRSSTPGKCSRCGMTLVFGIPDPEEYPVDLKVVPAAFQPKQKVELVFHIEDPKTGKRVTHFQTVHERLFHLFIVSSDLRYFVHDHPKFDPSGEFRFETAFPKPGMYRVLGDFYPAGGTPQLVPKTVFVPGSPISLAEAKLEPDLQPKKTENTDVELVLDPPHVIAGSPMRLILRLKPGEGLEKYLGAWGHMLAASDDLIDLLHEHPITADGSQIEFNLTLPRPRTYRIWVQFQRKGVVNTVAFNVPAGGAS